LKTFLAIYYYSPNITKQFLQRIHALIRVRGRKERRKRGGERVKELTRECKRKKTPG
jgi:hypothetical protein